MKLVSVLIFAVILSFAASPLRAELYEFEVKGIISGGWLPVYQVAVGDAITIRYTMDSTDQDPSPLGGYRGTTSVFETPGGVFSGDPTLGGAYLVQPVSQIVSYGSHLPGYPISLSLRFPEGTLTSDELPLSLPVSTALNRSFFVHPLSTFPSLFGTITSYEGRLVPEPNSLCLINVACATLLRRQT